MDTDRLALDPVLRRKGLQQVPNAADRRLSGSYDGCRPLHITDNVWIGFEICILPGVSIGTGSIIGAKSVVTEDIPSYPPRGG